MLGPQCFRQLVRLKVYCLRAFQRRRETPKNKNRRRSTRIYLKVRQLAYGHRFEIAQVGLCKEWSEAIMSDEAGVKGGCVSGTGGQKQLELEWLSNDWRRAHLHY